MYTRANVNNGAKVHIVEKMFMFKCLLLIHLWPMLMLADTCQHPSYVQCMH